MQTGAYTYTYTFTAGMYTETYSQGSCQCMFKLDEKTIQKRLQGHPKETSEESHNHFLSRQAGNPNEIPKEA